MTTTYTEPSPSTSTPDQQLARWCGTAGVLSAVLLVAFLVLSTSLGADPLTATRSALSTSLLQHKGASSAALTVVVSALTYVPLIGFLAGLRQLTRRWADGGFTSAVISIAGPLFLAGAMASDGFNLAIVIAEHSVNGLTVSPETATVFSAGWQVCLVEAQTALAVVCAAVAVGILRGCQSGAMIRIPRWAGIWGLIAAMAVLPLLLAPNAAPVFALSNVSRLSWILAVSVALLRRRNGLIAE